MGAGRGVSVARHRPDPQGHIENPFQPEDDLWSPVPVHTSALPDAGVGSQQVAVALDEGREMRATNLLFAFDDELDRDRKRSVDLAQRSNRRQSADDVRFVVGDAAPEELSFADCWLERGSVPQLQRLRRLNVVVIVKEQRAVGRTASKAEDDGVRSICRENLNVEPGAGEQISGKLRRFGHADGLSGDTRLSDEADEIRDSRISLALNGGEKLRIHRSA